MPDLRVRCVNDAPVRTSGAYVVYWMIAARRPRWNFALDRAVELARELDRPLLVLEPLRVGYPWASTRIHRFVLDGMADNAKAFEGTGVLYHPYVEPKPGAGSGLLEALAKRACAVVTDDYPAFFLPRMVRSAGERLNVRLEAVDSNGLLPMRVPRKAFSRAFDFRRFLQKELPAHLGHSPSQAPLRRSLRPLRQLPSGIARRWPRADEALLDGEPAALAQLPIDHSVARVPFEGGSAAGSRAVRTFVGQALADYDEERNHPDADATSRLSPFLHFGHVSAHEVFHSIARREGWAAADVSSKHSGSRSGWWGMGASAEAYLDQLVTWRELGFNFCVNRKDYDAYASLPDWAKTTLRDHEQDRRPQVYTRKQFESSETHDELWNAAQNQLRVEGRIHNYLRMLWGKKILHWSKSPRVALRTMIELNDKYAIDGRDPNSYSGIFWVLGRFDRAWGPERPVFGKVRYMSSKNTARKLHVGDYLERWVDPGEAVADSGAMLTPRPTAPPPSRRKGRRSNAPAASRSRKA